jgi:uncharacterized protein (TIGR03085 family)
MSWVDVERHSLAGDFRTADPDAPTLCTGWSVRHLCAHLVQREHSMLHNVWDQVVTRDPGSERYMSRLVRDASTPAGYAGLVDKLEAGPSPRTLMGRLDGTLNLVEYVIHHEDLRRGSGPVPSRDLPRAELDDVWRRARLTLRLAYRKAPVGVTLAPEDAPLMPVRRGPTPVTVAGPPVELLLHAFGRRRAADVQVEGSSEGVDSFNRWATAEPG